MKIFQADTSKLPAYVGAANEHGGYSIYKITQVKTPTDIDPTRLTSFTARLGDQVGRELLTAYLGDLKSRADVKINQTNLEKKQ